MKEYYITKRYVEANNKGEGFYIEKIKTGNRDIIKKIDAENLFEDDDDFLEYLSEVFDQDMEEIKVIEEKI